MVTVVKHTTHGAFGLPHLPKRLNETFHQARDIFLILPTNPPHWP